MIEIDQVDGRDPTTVSRKTKPGENDENFQHLLGGENEKKRYMT